MSRRRTLEGEAPDRTPHPGAMLDRWGLLGRFLSRLFFAPVALSNDSVDTVRQAAALGTVVYIIRMRNTLEFLYFNYAFLAHGLPLARFANGVRLFFWLPLRAFIRRLRAARRGGPPPEQVVARLTRARRSSTIFLRTPPGLGAPREFEGDYLKALVEVQRKQKRPIMLVPLTVIWGRPAVREADSRRPLKVLDPILGDMDEPRLLRRIWQVFVHARRSVAMVCEPLNLKEYLAAGGDRAGDDTTLVRNLDASLLQRIDGERRARIGPRRAHPIELRRQLLASQPVATAMEQEAQRRGVTLSTVRKRAGRELKRIQATMNSAGLRRLRWIIRRFWKRIFAGFEIDEAGMSLAIRAGTDGPLVFLPTHRSHLDYLLLSHLCLARDVVPPHIAAGANLSFWPLGWMFRTAGAFFIRRRLAGDPLYAALLREYVASILREGNNIEIFIEGTRSRSGRVLPPKVGLLSVIADLAAEGEIPTTHVVPVSIGYERVVELNSLVKELTGGKKRSESRGGLLRAAKLLRARYGFVNVQFAKPLEVREFLAGRGYVDRNTAPHVRRKAILALGYHSNSRAGAVTAVTPTSLTATALLSPGTRGVPRETVLHGLEVFARATKTAGARFVAGMWRDERLQSEQVLEYAVKLLLEADTLSVEGDGDDTIYVVEDRQRVKLEYFQNLISQHLVEQSLLAMMLRSSQAAGRDEMEMTEISRHAELLTRMVRKHFVLHAGVTLPEIVGRAVTLLRQQELCYEGEGRRLCTRLDKLEQLDLLARLLESTIESQGAVARGLLLLRDGPSPRRELERQVLHQMHRWYLTHHLQRYESCQMPHVRTAVDFLCGERILVQQSDSVSGETELALAADYSDGKALERLSEHMAVLLPPMLPKRGS